MAYCYEAGLPHSAFLSWEPSDRAKTMAFALEKGLRCTSCGTAEWEWQADPDAYVAVRQVCPGCMRREAVLADTAEPPKGSSVVMMTKSAALDMQHHPENYVFDSPALRRERRRKAEAERLVRLEEAR